MRTRIGHLAQIATPLGTQAKKGGNMAGISVVQDGAICMEDGKIVKTGPSGEVAAWMAETGWHSDEEVDGTGRAAVPGFVDSHTHFVFGGYRPGEFIERLEGAPYLSILQKGGGIQSTVRATREERFEDLLHSGKARLRGMLAQGVTTVEGKSGYGLDLETELRQLRVLEALDRAQPVDVVRTYLGAHAVPAGMDGDAYVDDMIHTVLPAVAGQKLAAFCDVFCEDGVFSLAQTEKLLRAAAAAGLRGKLHADEIVSMGGAELGVRLSCISCDHLLAVSEAGVKALAQSDTMATLLPCTAFCLAKPYAPARRLVDAGCAVALATDLNPGSCFTGSIPLLLALAVIHMGMTVEEALTAITLNGAAAVGRASRIGSLEPGKQADVVLLQYPDYRFLVYNTGVNVVSEVFKSGKRVYRRPL